MRPTSGGVTLTEAVRAASWWPEFLKVKDDLSWEALAVRFKTPAHLLKRAVQAEGITKVRMPPGGRRDGVAAPTAPAPAAEPPVVRSIDELAQNDQVVPDRTIDERIDAVRRLLGTMADAQVAKLASVSPADIRGYRAARGIAAFKGDEVAPPAPAATPAPAAKAGKSKAAPVEAPKAEAPKAEAPKAEAPKAAKVEAPKAAKAEAPKAAKVEAPKVEAPKAAKVEAPKAEAAKPAKVEAPAAAKGKAAKSEAPKPAAAPAPAPEAKVEAPKAKAEAPKVEAARVSSRQKGHGINKYGRRGHPLKKFQSMLGVLPDVEVAERSGVELAEVERYRKRKRIAPAGSPWRGRGVDPRPAAFAALRSAGGVAPVAKAEPAKAEAPKAAAKAEAPKVEAPKVEAPKAAAKTEAPKAQAPKVEAPKAEVAKVEAPKAAAPKVEVAEVAAAKVEAPKAAAPKVEAAPAAAAVPAPAAVDGGFAWRVTATNGAGSRQFIVIGGAATSALANSEGGLGRRSDGPWTIVGLERLIESL